MSELKGRFQYSMSDIKRPIFDKEKEKAMSQGDLYNYLNEYDNLINEIVDYLDTNELTNIGNNSILHEKCRFLTGK